MDVAQLVERLLPTSEIRGSNTVNGKIIFERLLSDENNEKRPGMPPPPKKPPQLPYFIEYTAHLNLSLGTYTLLPNFFRGH